MLAKVLFLALLAVSTTNGQMATSSGAPSPSDDVLARIIGPAQAPTNSVERNLVRVPNGTVYYGDAAQDNLYEGEGGPINWCKSNVSDTTCVCQTGQKQSPIDLSYEILESNNITADLMQRDNPNVLTSNYSTQALLNVTNPGHGTPQINVAPGSPKSTIEFSGRTLELLQIHFHAAGEHTFNSTRADLEAHAVHKDPTTNGIAVFGFMFQKSGITADPLLDFTLANRPNNTYRGPNGLTAWNATVVSSPVNVQTLLKPYLRGHFLYYQGSLTTPPCTEGVQWFLFPRLFDMTDEQYDTFEEYAGGPFQGTNMTTPENKRPAQPLNNRIVEFY
jgi:carbonic anhydrase